jgi:predicted ATPase
MRRTKEVVGPDDLSEGEAQAVLFALAFRAFGLRGSLVLVDEPELHIHASRRVPFLHGLIGLGPDNQLIVATGAAELLNAADPGQVIDLSAPVRREVRS